MQKMWGRKKRFKRANKQKTNYKLVYSTYTLPIITLNLKGENSLISRDFYQSNNLINLNIVICFLATSCDLLINFQGEKTYKVSFLNVF